MIPKVVDWWEFTSVCGEIELQTPAWLMRVVVHAYYS